MSRAGVSPSNGLWLSASEVASVAAAAHKENVSTRILHQMLLLKGAEGLDELDRITMSNLNYYLRMMWAGDA